VIYGASDASFKDNQASHAWIISTGQVEDVENPLLSIYGSGPVDGHFPDLSSTRGELQGQMAITIISNLFLQYHQLNATVHMVCDSKSAQSIATCPAPTSLRAQRNPDLDLQLQIQHESRTLKVDREWVKGHQDTQPWSTVEELKTQELPRDAIYNSWCDKLAGETRERHPSYSDAAVLPAEKWAVTASFPVPHKITRNFTTNIHTSLTYEDLLQYIHRRHNISSHKMVNVLGTDMQRVLQSFPAHNRATYAKLIHRWIPMMEFLYRQNRAPSPICL
jgi:hypothetical protein